MAVNHLVAGSTPDVMALLTRDFCPTSVASVPGKRVRSISDITSCSARERLKALPAQVRLGLSEGDEPEYAPAAIAFVALLDEIKPAGLDSRTTGFPGEHPNSVRLVSFPHGLYRISR